MEGKPQRGGSNIAQGNALGLEGKGGKKPQRGGPNIAQGNGPWVWRERETIAPTGRL
jgi:hypothetical protein